jgi:hypothetical protein
MSAEGKPLESVEAIASGAIGTPRFSMIASSHATATGQVPPR